MRWVSAAVVVALLGGVALWFTSEGQRLHRLVDDVRDERGVVASVVVDDEGIDEVHFTGRAELSEIQSVWQRLEDQAVDQVFIGDVAVDPFDLPLAADVALAVAEVPTPPARLAVREVGEDEVWLEAGFPQRVDGVAEPRPADGAAVVLALLGSLEGDELPEHLFLVAAHRPTEQLDLVLVERDALDDIAATRRSLRRVAATDPDGRIACDAEGCRAD